MQSSWKRSNKKKQNLKNKGEQWGYWKKEAEKKQCKSKANNFNLFNDWKNCKRGRIINSINR